MSPFEAVSLKGGLQGFVWLEETTTKKITHIQRGNRQTYRTVTHYRTKLSSLKSLGMVVGQFVWGRFLTLEL